MSTIFIPLKIKFKKSHSRLVGRNSALSTDNLGVAILLHEINILVSDTKFVLKVNSWLSCKCHSRSEKSVMVSFVEVR